MYSLKNREWFGEGREHLPELQGGFGGAQPPPTTPDGKFVTWGMISSDLDETWWKFFLQAPRSFLDSSGNLHPSGKREFEGKNLYNN